MATATVARQQEQSLIFDSCDEVFRVIIVGALAYAGLVIMLRLRSTPHRSRRK